jgi:protein SCO1
MNWFSQVILGGLLLSAVSCGRQRQGPTERVYDATGVITKLELPANTIVVKHEAIAGYMPAMTMPFHVREPQQIAGVRPGDDVRFKLHVTDNESWIDSIITTLKGTATAASLKEPPPSTNVPSLNLKDIPDFALTNELGQRVSLRQFRGQALALTFFFTRCPIPEFCPRLSKSLAEASRQLANDPGTPANWHLLSVSFDPLDTPPMLRAYAQQYRYDSNHWSFVTGDPAHIQALTHGFGISATPQEGVFVHDFRTAIFDTDGQLVTIWPFGGDTTQLLVQELKKAALTGAKNTRVDAADPKPRS